MYLLYADESGLVEDTSQEYFVLAGVSVFESVTQHIVQELNAVVALFAPQFPEFELHGSPIRSGKGVFRKRALKEREQLIKDALIAGVVNQSISNVRLFGCVVEKAVLVGRDPVHYCFEQIAIGFNLFLQARASTCTAPQCGIILFDESSMAYRLRTLAREFEIGGVVYGSSHSYAEVPVFLDSRTSRLIQLADLVAYSIFRHFEHNDSQYFKLLANRFDEEGGLSIIRSRQG